MDDSCCSLANGCILQKRVEASTQIKHSYTAAESLLRSRCEDRERAIESPGTHHLYPLVFWIFKNVPYMVPVYRYFYDGVLRRKLSERHASSSIGYNCIEPTKLIEPRGGGETHYVDVSVFCITAKRYSLD